MDSVDKQLTEMSKELESRSKAKVVLEAGLYTLVVLLLLVGNSLTLFIISFNRQMRTVPNMLVASLALTDFLFGLPSASPHQHVGRIPVAFRRYNLPIPRIYGCNSGTYVHSTLSLDGREPVFSNCESSEVPALLHLEKNCHHDSRPLVLWHLGSLALPPQWTQDGVSPFQVFLLPSDRQRSIHGFYGDRLHWITNLCYLLLLP